MSHDLFIKNKYTVWYFQIIEHARITPSVGYTEMHHIIPKSLEGDDTFENMVSLSARQHFVCHWLLTKMVSDRKDIFRMANAFNRMLVSGRPDQERYYISGRKFENARRECHKRLSGKFSPHYGIPKSPEHIKNLSSSIKKSYQQGRTVWNKGAPMRDATKQKLRDINTGKVKSEKSKIDQSLAMTGRNWYHCDDVRIFVFPDDPILATKKWKAGHNISRANPPKINTCSHCGRSISGAGNFKRWHGDNCKSYSSSS